MKKQKRLYEVTISRNGGGIAWGDCRNLKEARRDYERTKDDPARRPGEIVSLLSYIEDESGERIDYKTIYRKEI